MSSAEIPKFAIAPPAEFDVPNADIHVRLFDEPDADNLLRLTQEAAVQQYVPWAKRVHDQSSAADMIRSFRGAWDRKIMVRYVIEKGGEFVGYCGLWSDPAPGFYEFGFAMLPEFRGQGIGTNVVAELMKIAKTQMNAAGMVAYVHDTNAASKATVAKLGFQPTENFDAGDRRYELRF
jgi:RimJ/RimL family protein N-acetyltransferase